MKPGHADTRERRVRRLAPELGHDAPDGLEVRAFARVVESGSFTKAAATLHMSRTSVTQLVLADVDDAETSLSGTAQSARGQLRVDVPSPLARPILVPALADFHARYPEIALDLGVSDRPRVHQVRGRYALPVDDGNAYIAAGVAGQGVLRLPEYMAKMHRENSQLVALLEPMPLYLAFAPHRM